MANVIKRGESILIPFENGESVRDSQLKPRIYRTKAQYERFKYMCRNAELVEYAEVVRCKDCKYRHKTVSGLKICQYHITMEAKDEDFCSYGERREGE